MQLKAALVQGLHYPVPGRCNHGSWTVGTGASGPSDLHATLPLRITRSCKRRWKLGRCYANIYLALDLDSHCIRFTTILSFIS